MNKLSLENHRVVKSDSLVTLNFSAIAKGYACDVIGQLLTDRGIDDYMVEIGGEMVVRGRNPEGKPWRVGVNRPTIEGGEAGTIEEVLQMTGGGLATSGNYRNYRVVDGKRIAHNHRPGDGLSRAALAAECHRVGPRLHDGRRLCHRLYGDGLGAQPGVGRFAAGGRGALPLPKPYRYGAYRLLGDSRYAGTDCEAIEQTR